MVRTKERGPKKEPNDKEINRGLERQMGALVAFFKLLILGVSALAVVFVVLLCDDCVDFLHKLRDGAMQGL